MYIADRHDFIRTVEKILKTKELKAFYDVVDVIDVDQDNDEF